MTTELATEISLWILLRNPDHGICNRIIATEFATKPATELATEKRTMEFATDTQLRKSLRSPPTEFATEYMRYGISP